MRDDDEDRGILYGRFGGVILVVCAIAVIVSVLRSNEASNDANAAKDIAAAVKKVNHTQCLDRQKAAANYNKLARSSKKFMLEAANSRQASADLDTDPEQKAIDQKAADRYRRYANRIELLPKPNCDV